MLYLLIKSTKMVIKRILRPKCRALDFIVFCGKSLLQLTKLSFGANCLISIVYFFVTESYCFDSGQLAFNKVIKKTATVHIAGNLRD